MVSRPLLGNRILRSLISLPKIAKKVVGGGGRWSRGRQSQGMEGWVGVGGVGRWGNQPGVRHGSPGCHAPLHPEPLNLFRARQLQAYSVKLDWHLSFKKQSDYQISFPWYIKIKRQTEPKDKQLTSSGTQVGCNLQGHLIYSLPSALFVGTHMVHRAPLLGGPLHLAQCSAVVAITRVLITSEQGIFPQHRTLQII